MIDAAGVLHYILNDHLGQPQKMLNASGNVSWHRAAEVYGKTANQLVGAANDNPLRFPGQQVDPFTNLNYNYFRTYDPDTGRYLETDPIGLEGGMNLYAYVGGNPVNTTDPQGLYFTPDTLVDGGLILNDLYNLGKDAFSDPHCRDKGKFRENLTSLGLNIVGALIPGVTGLGAGYRAWRAADDAAKPFAMGLTAQGLEGFAKARGATTWKELPNPQRWQDGVLDKLANPRTPVHFNLDGVDVYQGVQRAASGRGGPTDWELLMIRQNPQYWDTLQFWKGGETVANPFR